MATTSGPRLPPELCDYVLDFLAPPYTEGFDGKWVHPEIPALAASTQVCRNWLPRARCHIYSHIYIQDPKAAFNLASSLAQEPALASQLREINVQAIYPDHGHFPLLRLLPLAPRLQCLALYYLDLYRNYPSSEIIRLGHCTSVTTLTLTWLKLTSVADLLRIIRSFRNLTSLRLGPQEFYTQTSASTIAELYTQRTCWAPRLRTLQMFNLDQNRLAEQGLLQLLSRNIEDLRLTEHYRSMQRLQGCLANCHRLKAFQYEATYQAPSIPNFDAPPSENSVSQWIHDALLDLPGAVRSPAMQSLHLAFRFSPYIVLEKHSKDALPHERRDATFRYLKTRGALLDEALDREFHDTLVGIHAFPHLLGFVLGVEEISPAHDEAWWRKQVETRLPGVPPGLIQVSLNWASTDDEYLHYDRLWEPDPEPSTQRSDE